jgi:hypothetical protein
VPAEEAGLPASLLNASQQLGGALGLAVLSALAASRTGDLLAAHMAAPEALFPASSAPCSSGASSCWRQP